MIPDTTREPLWRVAAFLAVATVVLQVLVTPVLDLLVAFGVTLTPDQRGAIEAVVRGVVGVLTTLGVAGAAHGQVTSVKAPTLPSGSVVTVEGSADTVTIRESPPGPTGLNRGAEPGGP